MSNIVTAVFGGSKVTRTRALYQWDYGQVLQFDGIELPSAYTVHFSNVGIGGEAKTMVGNADGVDIPDEYLTTGQTVYAWVYLHTGADDGETVYAVIIPVTQRPKPIDEAPTPVQQDAIDQAIAALNSAVEQTGADVETTGENVTAAQAAQEAAETAAGQAGTSTASAAQNASQAAQSAASAGVYASDAIGSAQSAVSAADSAAQSATDAEDSAVNAAGSAAAAAQNASSAAQSAEAAQDAVENVQSAIDTALAEAKASGEFDGEDGFSPVAFVEQTATGATVTVTDKTGTTTANLTNGADGIGVPAGGTTGQILAKTSDGTAWVDANPVESVTGTTPTITALPGIRYICGEVATLDITLPASGIVDVVFESGSTATVLTITPPTGQTVRWANGFDPTALDANTTYEINIADGLGVAASWT